MEEILKQVVGYFVVLLLFVLLFREGFEQLISQPFVMTLVGSQSDKIKAFGAGVKKAQPFLVILLAVLAASVFKLDLVTALTGFVALFPEGSMDTQAINLFSGLILGFGSMFAHAYIPKKTPRVVEGKARPSLSSSEDQKSSSEDQNAVRELVSRIG